MPPGGTQQPQFPVSVQTTVHTPSAPLVENSTPYNPHINQQPSGQMPYPPSPSQNRSGNPPYPVNSNPPYPTNNIGFTVDNRNNDLPPSYDQVRDKKF